MFFISLCTFPILPTYFEINSAYGNIFLSSFIPFLSLSPSPFFICFHPTRRHLSCLVLKQGFWVSSDAKLTNLWHACPKLIAENFLGMRHSLLSTYFISFAQPAVLHCEEHACIYIYTFLTPYRLYTIYHRYQKPHKSE